MGQIAKVSVESVGVVLHVTDVMVHVVVAVRFGGLIENAAHT